MMSQILHCFCALENKMSHIYLINTSPRFKYGSVISELRLLASFKTYFASVAQGALELYVV